jgi:hypothetical protein
MGEERRVYKILVGRPKRKRPLGRPRCRWEDNMKMDLREMRIDGVKWVQLAQDRVQLVSFCNRDSSFGIALDYELDDRGSRVRFPVGAGNFSLHHVKNSSGAHPASYSMGTTGSFPGVKAAGA